MFVRGDQRQTWLARVCGILLRGNDELCQVQWVYYPCDFPRKATHGTSLGDDEVFLSMCTDVISVDSIMDIAIVEADAASAKATGRWWCKRWFDVTRQQVTDVPPPK